MNIFSLFNTIKYKVRYGSIVEWYNFWYLVFHKKQNIIPRIATIDETIEKIVTEKCSISRFGDGEILLTECHAIGFQKGDRELAKRLKDIITSQNDKHLVCLSDTFTDIYRFTRSCRRFWRTHFYLYGKLWDKLLTSDRQYYNTFITRPYMDYASKEETPKWFNSMKKIWQNRDVIFIEGEKSRLGVGNDLFDNAKSIHRILGPACDAFDKYDEILTEALKQDKDVLFLIALGPTATVLAYDLFKAGYQAIDAGHVDIEYEWWKMGAKRKIKLERKYVNEAPNGNQVIDVGEEYHKQIIAQLF